MNHANMIASIYEGYEDQRLMHCNTIASTAMHLKHMSLSLSKEKNYGVSDDAEAISSALETLLQMKHYHRFFRRKGCDRQKVTFLLQEMGKKFILK